MPDQDEEKLFTDEEETADAGAQPAWPFGNTGGLARFSAQNRVNECNRDFSPTTNFALK